MPRQRPNPRQDFLSSVILPLISIPLIPISITAIILCLVNDRYKTRWSVERGSGRVVGLSRRRGGEKSVGVGKEGKGGKGCVIISGGRMTKGLTLARAFKRAGWEVIGVEEEGWAEFCPLRFSSSLSSFHLLPPASSSYSAYSQALIHIAQIHRATLFIPVSGAGSSVEDSLAADEMYAATGGRCRTFIQDPETMRDLHDKDRFINLVDRLGMRVPGGKMVESVNEAMEFLREEGGGEPKFVLKCMGLDENRGDMTLFPLKNDGEDLGMTKKKLEGLKLGISRECPYVFQEYIPGQEWCTHASVVRGRLTSFVAAPSNDMLMTYENATSTPVGQMAEEWTTTFLAKLQNDPIPASPSDSSVESKERGLTGHFSFDFILSTKNSILYPIECNARVHTAVILLPLDGIADCYTDTPDGEVGNGGLRPILRPIPDTKPRSWIYNDLIMRYLPRILPPHVLDWIHPSLPACSPHHGYFLQERTGSSALAMGKEMEEGKLPNDSPWIVRVDPTLVADDWVPFLVLWHVFWPYLLITRWWQGKKWTRLNVSTGRIFEA